MAILEAASCGLFVVSTNVGGIAEVLAPDMIAFAKEPTADAIFDALSNTILNEELLVRDPFEIHMRVKEMYNWFDIALRVARIYDEIKKTEKISFSDRLYACRHTGTVAGLLNVILVVLDYFLLTVLETFKPSSVIERVPYISISEQ